MSRRAPRFTGSRIDRQARIGIVAARFNWEIVRELLAGCLGRLEELGISKRRLLIERVPGAFEIPLAAKAMCRRRNVSAVICLGAVVRGQTPHFDYVAGEAARGIA